MHAIVSPTEESVVLQPFVYLFLKLLPVTIFDPATSILLVFSKVLVGMNNIQLLGLDEVKIEFRQVNVSCCFSHTIGLREECSKIPLQFFMDELLNNKRIVLSGTYYIKLALLHNSISMFTIMKYS